jgi:PAS domain S-box-containing protein
LKHQKRDPQQIRHADLLLLTRLILATLSLGAFYLFQEFQEGGLKLPEEAAVRVYSLLGVSGGINGLYLLLHRTVPHTRFLLGAELVFDLLLGTGVVYLTGGALSIFVPLYFGSILSACFLLSPQWGMVFASLATIAMSTITYLYAGPAGRGIELTEVYVRFIRQWGLGFFLAYLSVQAVALHFVAFLGWRLASGWHRVRWITQVILDGLAQGVIAVDRKGRVLFANPWACRVVGGISREEMLGRPLPEGPLPGRLREILLCEGGEGAFETELNAAGDAHAVPLEVRVSRMTDHRGKEVGKLVRFTDLSMRKRMETERLRADRLQSASEMAAGIAHEIRNPLASIRGAAQEMKGRLAEGERARLLDLLIRECDRLDGIVKGVLGFARPLRVFRSRFDLGVLLGEVRLHLARAAGGRPVEIRVEGVEGALQGMGDIDLLNQVFINLGTNALQACRDRPGLLIRYGRSTDGGLFVEFSDQGEGMSPEVQEKLFRPFFTTRSDGVGLGLAISHRIVEAHGGRIEVESAPGKGSCFRVHLPGSGAPGSGETAPRRTALSRIG